MDPKGKAALINGGARVGAAVVRALAARGCAVAVTWRGSREAAERSVEEARRAGVPAQAFQADARDEADVARAVQGAVSAFRRLDILVNMASTYVRAPLESLDGAAWQEAIDSNARGAYLFSLAAAPHLRKEGAGRIVNFADWLPASGRPRYTGYLPYYVGKGAVVSLTESLALELAPDILVNAVAPGPIVPPPDLTPEENARVVAATPLRRWGGAEEMAKAVLFLVETDFVTGECIRADGGRHLY
ncbi:MAG TPA: SDR family oxidoreductase [Candidatus Polarisedimenticolia bacterium]|nr:SDR family oxidoreductase [Candidatus Polarisedimenticolia bacterium]